MDQETKAAPKMVAVWRCQTCDDHLTMPAAFAEMAGYRCCYKKMEYLGTRQQG